MAKTVYSLVLNDEVVREIDKLAYREGTNRSGMINRILAEYVSYTTPEMQVKEIFSSLERILTGGPTFRLLLQPSDSMISLRSALTYKYNPTVRYSVELYRGSYPVIGELRVSLRSQNAGLLMILVEFFRLWARIEGCSECSITEGRYARKLRLREGYYPDTDTLGHFIAGYINLLDSAMKDFFSSLDDPAYAARLVERRYIDYYSSGRERI